MLGKSDGAGDEEKLNAENIISINLLDRPSPLKVNRFKEFERIGSCHGIELKTRKVHGTV